MAQTTSKHVFISYSRRDSEAMQRIVKYLRGQGIEAWVDNESLVPGTPIWEHEIEKAIIGAFAIVVILSPDAKRSEWVLREITLADEYQKRVFPVIATGDFKDSVPFRLVSRQFVDIRSNEFSGFASLTTALTSYLQELERLEEERQTREHEAEIKAREDREAKAEAARLAMQKADEDRLAKEKAEIDRRIKEEAERLFAEKAEQQRLAKAKADTERKARAEARRKAKAESERIAAQQAEQERLAGLQAEQQRLAKQKIKDEQAAKSKAESDQKAKAERNAKAEADRLAASSPQTRVSTVPQKKPIPRGVRIGIVSVVAVAALALASFGISKLMTPIATATQEPRPAATEAPATEAPGAEVPTAPFVFGMLLVGSYNDHGWSQAHYEAGQYVEEKLGAKMIYLDKVNPADRPGTTPDQLAEELVAEGAQLIIFDSDEMKDASTAFAKAHPDIYVIMASGDQVWSEGKSFEEIPNMVNIMGRMEYGKMIAGCAAALSTKTGQIGYLGALINDQTRRLAASAYLGAKHCWTEYVGQDAADLEFNVAWIGFWFNIPGITLDPTQAANEFINSGYDVIISGIDTTEGLTEAKKAADGGKEVFAVPYNFSRACEDAASVCLGVPYLNWGPAYLETITAASEGTLESNFQWNGPDWSDLNNPDTSAVGFVKGEALSAEAAAELDEFIAALAAGLNLWTGPINLQDGRTYLADGEVATDQHVWYLPQLLEGMEGQSVWQ